MQTQTTKAPGQRGSQPKAPPAKADTRPSKGSESFATKSAFVAAVARGEAKPLNAKPLEKGSGALVGVAKGAMDGQPHTKQAVREARAKALAEQHAPTAPGTPGATKASKAAFAKAMGAQAAKLGLLAAPGAPRATPAPKVVASKVPKAKAAAPAPKADGPDKIVIVATGNPYKAGTKAFATFALMAKLKSVAKVRAHVEATGGSGASGQFDAGYLRYSSRDGHIRFE